MERPHYTGTEPCTEVNGDLFFDFPPLNGNVTNEMKSVMQLCMSCPLLWQCREYAIHHEEYGIWGGTLPWMRDNERRRRKMRLERPKFADWIPGRVA